MDPWAHNLRRSFATLAKHHKAGNYDRTAALRLLRNNARDTGAHGPERERLAARWCDRFEQAYGINQETRT